MTSFKILFKLSASLLAAAAILCAQQTVIVRVSPGSAALVDATYGLTVVRSLDSSGNVQLISFPDTVSRGAFFAAAALNPLIVSAESEQQTEVGESDSRSVAENSTVSGTVDPLVPGSSAPVSYFGNMVRQGYAAQPAALLINLPAAQAGFGPGAALVAVIDSGVDPDHPALKGVFVPGYDFLTNTPGIPSEISDVSQSTVALLDQVSQPVVSSALEPLQLNQSTVALLDQSTVALLDQSTVALLDSNQLPKAFGHGTMIAGLIHLVAPGVQIMPLRAFYADGSGNISDIVNAIYYATDHGANVINMSFSSTSPSAALTAAIQYAVAHKVICVAAAGNLGREIKVYPASIRGVIGVGSTNGADLRSGFSNYDEGSARTAAPGEALITSYPRGNYAGVWGTSFSAALVSGTVALGKSASPRGSMGKVGEALDKGHKISDQGLGDARLDVLAYLKCISNP
jgi:subtilisin family serine protease